MDYEKYRTLSRNAKGLDYFNDNDRYYFVKFSDQPGADPPFPAAIGNLTPNDLVTFKHAITFAEINTIMVGSAFGANEFEKEITILHEILHLYFPNRDHVYITDQLKLGKFTGKDADNQASMAIDDWFKKGCGK